MKELDPSLNTSGLELVNLKARLAEFREEGLEGVDVEIKGSTLLTMNELYPNLFDKETIEGLVGGMNFADLMIEGLGGELSFSMPLDSITELSVEQLKVMQKELTDNALNMTSDIDDWFKKIEAEDPSKAFMVRQKMMFDDLMDGNRELIDENGNLAIYHAGRKEMIFKTEREFLNDFNLLTASANDLDKDSITIIEEQLKFFEDKGLLLEQYMGNQVKTVQGEAEMMTLVTQLLSKKLEEIRMEEDILRLTKEINDEKAKDKGVGAETKEEVKQLNFLQKIKERYNKINEQQTRKKTLEALQSAQTETTAWLIEAIMKSTPFPINLILAAAAESKVEELFSKLGNVKKAQYGADFIADSPQLMMVGEGSGAERVQVTPLVDPNLEGTQGQGITLNISGNVLTDSFVEDSIIPAVREATRMGENLGV